jgi:DNA-3-methyladenine glycosylase II
MATVTITPRGPFSLAASARFLEGFAPARYHGHALDGAVRLAFPADDGHSTVGAAVHQAADGHRSRRSRRRCRARRRG